MPSRCTTSETGSIRQARARSSLGLSALAVAGPVREQPNICQIYEIREDAGELFIVEAPGGTLLTSHTVQSSLGDLFRPQDDIARRVVEALSLPLAGGTASPAPGAPHNARAYEL